MIKIIRLAALAVILYFGVTVGLPWIQERVEGISQEKLVGKSEQRSPAASCVKAGDDTHRYIYRGLFQYARPDDTEAWTQELEVMNGMIADSERTCLCTEPACDKIREGLGQMRSQVADFDRGIRGGPVADLTQRQERIEEILQEARIMLTR